MQCGLKQWLDDVVSALNFVQARGTLSCHLLSGIWTRWHSSGRVQTISVMWSLHSADRSWHIPGPKFGNISPFQSPTVTGILWPVCLPHQWGDGWKWSGKGYTKVVPPGPFSLAVSPHLIVRPPLTPPSLLQAFTTITASFSKYLLSLEPNT